MWCGLHLCRILSSWRIRQPEIHSFKDNSSWQSKLVGGYRNLDPHPIPNQFRSSTQPRDLTTCFSTTSIEQVDCRIPTSPPAALIIKCQEKPQPPPPFCSTVDGYPLPTTASSIGPGSSAANTPNPSLGSRVLAWSLRSLLTASSETESRLGVSAAAVKFVNDMSRVETVRKTPPSRR